MPKIMRRRYHEFSLRVHTSAADIEEGKHRKQTRCMQQLAITRALGKEFPDESAFGVRVNGGHIHFKAQGYRWKADTHRIAKANLIAFDHHQPVEPHNYTLRAQRMSRVVKRPAWRSKQIYAARKRRAAEGRPDKRYTLHQRVVGFA